METDRIRISFTEHFQSEYRRKIEHALHLNSTISCFSISGVQVTPLDVPDLCHLLRTNRTLKTLELAEGRFKAQSLRKLLQCLTVNTTLEHLSFGGAVVTDAKVEHLARLCKSNSTLRSFRFANATFGDDRLGKLVDALEGNSTMECLNFWESELTDRVVDSLVDICGKDSKLQDLSFGRSRFSTREMIRLADALKKNSTITHISFEQSAFTDHAISDFCNFLRGNSSLTNLSFTNSDFSDDGIGILLRGLQGNSTLKQLSFVESTLMDDAAADLGELFVRNSSISELQFGSSTFTDLYIQDLVHCLKRDKVLQSLNFQKSRLTNDIIPDICNFVKDYNKRVRNLGFGEATLTDSDLQTLLYILRSNSDSPLTHLFIWGCPLTNEDVSDVCLLCKQNTTLVHLWLNPSRISEKGMNLVLKGLQITETVEVFKLSDCELADSAVLNLYDILSGHQSLRSLRLTSGSEADITWALETLKEGQDIVKADLTGKRGRLLEVVKEDGKVEYHHPTTSRMDRQSPGGAGKVEEKGAREMQFVGERFLETYKKAISTGSQTVYQTRVMIVGHHGTGKTSLLHSLLYEPFGETRKSTIGIDHNTETMKVDATTGKWTKARHKGSDAIKTARKTLKKTNDKARTDFAEQLRKTSETQGNYLSKIGSQISGPMKNALKKEVSREEAQKNVVAELFFWDFAGQAAFYCTHQTFLTSQAVYVLVLDVTQSLDDKIVTYRMDERGKKVPDTGYPGTVQEYIDHWMSSIFSLHTMDTGPTDGSNTTPMPQVIIVFTHIDMYSHDDTLALNNQVRQVMEHVRVQKYSKHVITHFTISNKDRDLGHLQDLRNALQKAALSYDMPDSWMTLKRSLKKGGKKTKTWHEAMELGVEVGIESENELRHALGFLHTVGEVIFFDELSFRDVIITDPKWLITQMKQVITVPSLMTKIQFKGSDTYWRHLEVFGVVHLDMLRYVWPQESIQDLLTILKKLQLLLPLPRHYVLSPLEYFGPPEGLFLVPCLLPPSRGHAWPSSPVPPIILQPERRFIPLGLTSRLICGLIGSTGWRPVGEIFRDSSTLLPDVKKPEVKVMIQQRDDCILVHAVLSGQSEVPAQSLNRALQTVVSSLRVLTSTICPLQAFRVVTTCGKCKEVQQLGDDTKQLQETIRCTRCHTNIDTTCYNPWFKEVHAKSTSTVITEHQPTEDIRRKLSTTFRDNITKIEHRLDYDDLKPHLEDAIPRMIRSKVTFIDKSDQLRYVVGEVVLERISAVSFTKALLSAGYTHLLREIGLTANQIKYIRGLGDE